MLTLSVQGPHFEKQHFLPEYGKNVLGYSRCLGINEEADKGFILA